MARWKARLHALAAPGTGGPGRFRGQFARHARSWLSEARTGLFPELSQRLPGTAILRWLTDDRNAAIGPPGATYAVINVCREASPFRGTSTVLYSPRAWQHLLATMASVYPFDVRFMMMPLDEAGRLVDSRAAVVAAVSRDQADPRWVRFVMRAPKDLISWGRSKVQEEWIQFAESWAGQLDACYGHLSDDADDAGSVLEMATQTLGIDPPTVPRCREVLRGYSWVTVCAPELAQRLGGVPALTASGAFHQVRELPGGQILLRATPRLEQYKGAAVERVFRTLAPVLLTGRTARDRAPVLARLVLAADAADHRLAGSPAKIKEMAALAADAKSWEPTLSRSKIGFGWGPVVLRVSGGVHTFVDQAVENGFRRIHSTPDWTAWPSETGSFPGSGRLFAERAPDRPQPVRDQRPAGCTLSLLEGRLPGRERSW